MPTNSRSSSGVDTTRHSSFRPDIEGLRAIAIMSVVGYHAGIPGFGGGYVGVDIFFVISGFLISSLLIREVESTGNIDLLAFYARRARRLLPAVSAMVVITASLAAIIYAPLEQTAMANSAIATSAYVSNFYFARTATDYLGAPSETNPFLHTWSLSVEEQFYLVWPLFILFAFGSTRINREHYRGRLLAWMAAVICLSFAASIWLTWRRQPWAFFLAPPRAWEFAIGGMLAAFIEPSNKVHERTALRTAQTARITGWLGSAAIVGSVVLFSRRTEFPGFAALVPTIGAIGLLVAGTSYASLPPIRLLSARPFQLIGRLSYSWYLWHWPVLVLLSALWAPLPLVARIGSLVLSLILAETSYRIVENPIRFRPILVRSTRKSLFFIAGTSAICVAITTSWHRAINSWSQRPLQRAAKQASEDLPALYRDERGCDQWYFSSELRPCDYGPPQAEWTIVLFGDSHAGQWYSTLYDFAARNRWKLVVLTKSNCPAAEVQYYFASLGRTYDECDQWRKRVVAYLRSSRPDLVVLSSASTGYPITPDEWGGGTRAVVAAIQNSVGHVAILRDTPYAGFRVPECLARSNWRPSWMPGHGCNFPSVNAVVHNENHERQGKLYSVEQAVAHEFPNVFTLDMDTFICPSQECVPIIHGMVVMRDANHLTNAFAASLEPRFAAEIARRIGQHLM